MSCPVGSFPYTSFKTIRTGDGSSPRTHRLSLEVGEMSETPAGGGRDGIFLDGNVYSVASDVRGAFSSVKSGRKKYTEISGLSLLLWIYFLYHLEECLIRDIKSFVHSQVRTSYQRQPGSCSLE